MLFFFEKSNILGQSRNLSERVLGIKMRKKDQRMERALSFDLINRLIVWTAVGKSLSSMLDIFNLFDASKL